MSRVIVVDHPLIQHKLTYLRDRNTGAKDFRELLEEISLLLAFEVTRDIPLIPVSVRSPFGEARGHRVAGKMLGVVAILRAGLGMVEGILRLVPKARVGHIGLYRDPKRLRPVEYFCKLPSDIKERFVIVVDPMLATGHSAVYACQKLKHAGVKRIRLMCLVASPPGITVMRKYHPEIDIYTAAIDHRLDAHGYIRPGLGDAGDRLFGTR